MLLQIIFLGGVEMVVVNATVVGLILTNSENNFYFHRLIGQSAALSSASIHDISNVRHHVLKRNLKRKLCEKLKENV